MKKIKGLISKLRFGAVETIKGVLPGGSVVVKIVEHFTKKDLATGANLDRPTDWMAVVVRVAGLAVLLYLLIKGIIPVDVLLDFIKSII
jgi:hypothetical protein